MNDRDEAVKKPRQDVIDVVSVAAGDAIDDGVNKEGNGMDLDLKGKEPAATAVMDAEDAADAQQAASSSTEGEETTMADDKVIVEEVKGDPITICVIYSKKKYEISTHTNETIAQLKHLIQVQTDVPVKMQKLMYKGQTRDEQKLCDLKVVNNAKFMLVGSKLNEIESVSAIKPGSASNRDAESLIRKKQPLCLQRPHSTVLEKHGVPEEVMGGLMNAHEPLPDTPLFGMYNKHGGKIRLTFKYDTDELWMSTKERTEKIPMGSINCVKSEPIVGHEEYHMMSGWVEAACFYTFCSFSSNEILPLPGNSEIVGFYLACISVCTTL